ncbi:sporulation-control protein [Kibdelosporangium banguiense]|uniref:Sporulation-control protein n=1 Tax=Kibdelosporangium banguiense TaxID=1365924 RepID=A0ABS4TVS2_9PSEU|nr:sporulation protein [Kibdelosporangium banguiense]MBP2328507.1 sporulation-control protein [Kibdelosporangium banguiense]
MFKRMLNAFGIGGPSVDTVLDSPHAVPGQAITGQVRIQGGSADAEIGQIVLSLVTQVEVEHAGGFGFDDDNDQRGSASEFYRMVVQQGVRVPAGQLVTIPFQLQIPWETPITAVGGSPLPRMSVGVRTELLIAGAPDKGDLDPLIVSPLPSQNKVLDAFGQLGFSFRSTDVETGRLPGVPQELGFYQELEFFPPAQFVGRMNQVELTFVANPHELYVVLDADKHSGAFSSGGDTSGWHRVSHQEALGTDWTAAISGWLTQAAERGHANPAFGGQPGGHNPAFGGQPGGHNPAFGGQPGGHNPAFGGQPGYDRHGHDRHDDDRYDQRGQQRGAGRGGMLAAGAAGVAGGVLGGMALGGIADEFFGDDEG